ncbi:MAG: trypsin-like peptidase domain-containing protein [Chloroflexota bacterium]|nr:trypsin-like peptidase domain-containing protein [Chloroflexota bacterium]
MTHDPNRPIDRDQTEPVEVQHYGPPSDDPNRPTWQAVPAWSSARQAPRPAPAERPSGLRAAPLIAIAVVAGILSGAFSAVAVTNLISDPAAEVGSLPSETPGEADPVSEVRIDESNAVIDAVNRVAPAVVLITVSTGGGLFGGGEGTGSGVIYDANGWILTNRHVVEDAQALIVELNDGRTFDATLYGIDPLTDLAIIKVDATDLPVAPIGSSSDLEPGQLAIAIGNPLGYKHTVTTGIVSGLGRVIQASGTNQASADTLRNLIQTDAAINPGNSGGPLVNSAGQVIGINTAVSTQAQGLGFAIPIDVAKPIMQQALDGEELVRPWIGVYYTEITPALAETEDLPVDYGALIGRRDGPAIVEGSPAEAAGLRDGDIIVGLDGETLSEDRDLASLILPYDPGDTVTLRVLRGNTATEIEVTLGELPPQ